MQEVKQINIKNRTYYVYNDIIDLKNFESNLLKIDEKHYKEINIYYIGYITIKRIDEYESICSVILCICTLIMQVDILKKKNWNKYSIFDSVDENKEVLKKYRDVWDGIKNKIKAIDGREENNYEKDYMKIKFNSDDDLQLNKPLKFYLNDHNYQICSGRRW